MQTPLTPHNCQQFRTSCPAIFFLLQCNFVLHFLLQSFTIFGVIFCESTTSVTTPKLIGNWCSVGRMTFSGISRSPKNFWLNAAESRVNTRKATYSCIYPSISSYDLLLKCGQLDIIPACEAHKDSQGKLCGGKEPRVNQIPRKLCSSRSGETISFYCLAVITLCWYGWPCIEGLYTVCN